MPRIGAESGTNPDLTEMLKETAQRVSARGGKQAELLAEEGTSLLARLDDGNREVRHDARTRIFEWFRAAREFLSSK